VDQCTELKGLGDFVSSGKKKDESRSHKQARGLYKMSSSCTFFMGFDDKKKKKEKSCSNLDVKSR
jgi:hypothetical protein